MSDPSSSTTPRAPWGRLAVTIALLLVVGLMPAIGLPGVDTSGLMDTGSGSPGIDVFALGIMPFVSGAIVVELAAVAVPRWRRLRHGGPEGRAALGRATLIVAAALCVFQGYGITIMLEKLAVSGAIGFFSAPMVILTMTAGTFLLGLLAQSAGMYGLTSGLALLIAGLPVIDGARAIASGKLQQMLSTREAAGLAAGAAIVVVATWALLRAPRPGLAPASAETTYRAPPPDEGSPRIVIPAPASGLAPLVTAAYIVSVPAALQPAGALSALLARDPIHRAAMLLVIALLTVVLAWLFNAPARIAALATRAGSRRSASDLDAEARGSMRDAALRSALYLVTIFAIGQVAWNGPVWTRIAVTTAMLTAIVLDLSAEWRARRTLADLVPIWPEHRPYALAAARAALADAGIRLHARGEHLRRLLQFGGPFAPIDLMVPRADEAEAREILRKVLLFRPEDEASTKTPVPPRRWTRAESGLLAATVLLAGGTLLLPGDTTPLPASRAPLRPEALQLVPLDDAADVFEMQLDGLPPGLSISAEEAPLGMRYGAPSSATRRFAQIVKGESETMDQARARLLAWAEKRPLPEGDRLLVGVASDYDPEKGRLEPIGWRTYVAKNDVVVDGRHVRGARAVPTSSPRGQDIRGWYVRVELDPEGAERFRAFTAANIKRRLAIVVDGKVESAPVIQSEIAGGTISITMGHYDPEQQLRDAQKLEKRLLGR